MHVWSNILCMYTDMPSSMFVENNMWADLRKGPASRKTQIFGTFQAVTTQKLQEP